MSRAEHTVVIERPPAEVFAFLTDLERLPMWQSTLLEAVALSDGPLAVGSRFRDVRRFLGVRFESIIEVVRFDPPGSAAVRVVEGPVGGQGSYELRPFGTGTQVRFAYQLDAAGFFRLTELVATRLIVREFESNLGHLRDLLEARAVR